MKKHLFLLSGLFLGMVTMMTANPASAAQLQDVTILEVTSRKDLIELKLHAKNGPEGSYFFVEVAKSDAEAFDKLGLVAQKLQKGDSFRLSLKIKSFSMSPSGSNYPSSRVKFSGSGP